MNKNTKILLIGLFLGLFVIASQASAAGLVPCGRSVDDPDTPLPLDESADCTLCHFFILIERILEFVFFNITPPLALLMLIIGGGMFMLAAGDPQKISTARKIITNTLIGIVIIYGAFFLVGLLLQSIHLARWIESEYQSWWTDGMFNIDCPIDNSSTLTPATAFTPPTAPGINLTTIPIDTTFSSGGVVIIFP